MLETRGPFEIRGRLVVFTRLNGTLASLRLDEVDLPASRPAPTPDPAASAEPRRERPPSGEVRELEPDPEPQLPETLPLEESEPAILPIAAPAPPPLPDSVAGESPHLLVQSWEKILVEDGGGVEIHGTLYNHGETVATQISVIITALGSGDRILGRQRAGLPRSSVTPGSAVSFSARFPGLTGLEALGFQVESRQLELGFASRGSFPEP